MSHPMRTALRAGLVMTVSLSILTGLVYPGTFTVIARTVFPAQASGSLVAYDGRIVGSALVGQSFTRDEYFHGRPSNAGSGYDGMASSGTNLGPTSGTLLGRVIAAVDSVRAREATASAVPIDAVTASASGLDPHISPAYAALQVARVASARGVAAEQVTAVLQRHTAGRQLGLLGEPRVNVLLLNIALDSLHPAASAATRADTVGNTK